MDSKNYLRILKNRGLNYPSFINEKNPENFNKDEN